MPGSSIITPHTGSPVQADPAESGMYLEWDIDSLLGYSYSLPPGEHLTISFHLGTDCNTISGTHVVTAQGSGFLTSPSDALSVEIFPGGIRLRKEPGETEARVGDVITWTITVESTGLGPIHNVVVTDTLGPGLAYVDSTPAGTVNGQQVIWDSTTVPELQEIPAGGQVQLQLQAEVVACEGLDNAADARFGCDGETCYDTAVDGGTATASIHLLVDNPLLDFSPPDIQIPYCDPGGATVTMPVTNTGAGLATAVRICVDFPSELQVQNVQGGASWDGSCFHLPDFAAGETFDLTFDLIYTDDWCAAIPSGTLYWQAIYENVCGDEFRPPAMLGTYGTSYDTAGPPTLSVSLSGDDQVYICTEHSYSLSVDFAGLNTCGGGTTSDISVTVDVPQGFTVTDPGGGTWTPGGGGTGGTITWAGVDPDMGLTTSFALLAPGSSQCGDVVTLTVTATATDCCGCGLSASYSIPIAVECYQLVTTTREASPLTQEKCGTITYINTYVFADDPALDGISFDELLFTEEAANGQDYVEGSLTITIDGAPASPITVVDNTPGGAVEIRGINDTRSVRGHTLVISYEMAFTASSEPTSCPNSYGFYDWTRLDLGPDCTTGDQCTEPCQATDVLQITTATPSMSVSVTGLPDDFVDPCGTYEVTVTLTKTSDFDPYNVRLQLENLNYYIVDLSSITCGGDVTPTNCTSPADYGTYYEWDYGDAFVGQPQGARSILQFQVRKRCNPGRDLVATALFEDSCGYSSCSASASDTPSIMRSPLLYVYKTPEVIYATANTLTWTVYVTNGGAGPAYEVWVDDILGDGLVYDSSTVDPDVTVTVGVDHTGAPINGATFHIPEIAPGGTRMIGITARMVTCQELTNLVRVGQSCGDVECVIPVEDSSAVLIPDTVLIATSYMDSPLYSCTEGSGTITIRNAGDPTAYDLVARMVLPPGLDYVSGSTEWRVDGGGWNTGGDPTTSGDIGTGYTLEWDEIDVAGLSELPGDSTIELRYELRPLCNFNGGYVETYVDYVTLCGEQGTIDAGLLYVEAANPNISVTMRQVDPPPGNPIDCGTQITWEIVVENIGSATADYVWVEGTLGNGFTYISSQGDGVYAVDDGYNSGQLVTWALEDLPPGASATLTLTAQDNRTCGDLSNSVQAWWGCGDDLDSSSATNDAECLTSISVGDSTLASRTPDVDLNIDFDVTGIEPCGEATLTLTIANPTTASAAAVDAVVTLPAGISYLAGSAEVDCGTGFSPAPDPQISGQTLTFYDLADTTINLCDPIPPGGSARLRFRVEASCYTTSEIIPVDIYFYDCCLTSQLSGWATAPLDPALPSLSVSVFPEEALLDCHDPNNTVTWTITVNNAGSGTAEWVRIEYTLGSSLVYVSSNPAATELGGNTYAWELGLLGPGDSAQVQLEAYLTRPPDTCADSYRTSAVRVTWGCGTPDGDPTTPEGCETGIWAEDIALVTIPDLTLSSSDITPILTCGSDGGYSGRVQIRVSNNGDAPITEDFLLTITEATTGWTSSGYFSADFGGTLPINPGSSHTIYIDHWPVTCQFCDYRFTVVLDVGDDICECKEDNNVKSRSYTITLPDLTVDSTDLSLACSDDGEAIVSGTVTVTNLGCGADFTEDIPVRFTIYDASSCSGAIIHQWTETFTGVRIPAGGSQTFEVSRTISTDICGAADCTAALAVELDPGDQICECEGTNNDACSDLPVDIPDLVVNGEGIQISCAADGRVRISGTVTLGNEGCGAFSGDIPGRITLFSEAGCTGDIVYQWEETFTGASIPAGGTQTFSIDKLVSLDLCAAAGCDLYLLIESDHSGTICECNGDNNSLCVAKQVGIADLAVISVEPHVPDACSQGSVTVTVKNVGCVPTPQDIPVRISGDATGEALLPALPPGETQQMTIILNEVLPCGSYSVAATVDPDDSLCECDSENNASPAWFEVVDPDLVVQHLAVSCNLDGSVTVALNVGNSGTEASLQAEARLYIDGHLAHQWTVPPLGVGESVELTWTTPSLKCGELHEFRMVVDEDDSLCECDEGNNEATVLQACPCPALVTAKEAAEVLRGGVPVPPGAPIEAGDVILYRLEATNVGGANAYDVDFSDNLPAEFLYLSGTTEGSWPSGSYTSDPAGVPGPDLVWDTSAMLGPGETLTLEFQAVVTSAVVQGLVYTNTMCATGEEGDGTPIPSDNSSQVPQDDDPDDCSSVSQVAAAVPALSVDKEIVDVLRGGVSIWPTDAVEPGDLIHYRFTVRNVGEGTAYDVDLTDELPTGLEYDTDYAAGVYIVDSPAASGSLGIPDGTTGHLVADISAEISGGGTLVADFYAYVTSAVRQGIDLENYATAAGEDGYGIPIPPENVQIGDTSDDDPDDPDPDDTGLAVIGVHEPGLSLDKEIVDVLRGGVSIWPTSIVLPEDVIVYRVVVHNVGLGTAYHVDLRDVLPPGVEYETSFGEGTYVVDSPAQAGTLGIPDGATGAVYADISVELAPGATLIAEYRVRVRPDVQPGTVLENLAEVSGTDGAGGVIPVYNDDVGDSYPDSDSVGIRVGIPALVTDKRVYFAPCCAKAPSLLPGTSFQFLLTVKNVGYSTAYDIVVEDLLPQGLSYVAGSTEIHLGDLIYRLEPISLPGSRILNWYTGLSLQPGDYLGVIFTVRMSDSVAIGEILENFMHAWGIDDLSRPIPADASAYVPADTDPDDATLLRIKVGDPSWLEPPPTCHPGVSKGGE
ncbi:MAG TPA: DUF11 domain-containing protein [Anaerolineales bacterium]|nr:DUF11 domain-containing protein [Anaerolineales bacterium]